MIYMNAQAQTDHQPTCCDICGSDVARELYKAKYQVGNSSESFTIAECVGCGVLRTLPVMGERDLSYYYPSDCQEKNQGPREDLARASQTEKIRFLNLCGLSGGRILDVGCGPGLFLRALDPLRWNRFGVEAGKAASEASNRALGQGRVFYGTLIESACEDAYFDVVTFWSTLGHTNHPGTNLKEARRIMKTGGALIVQVPNAASYQARAFGGDWSALDVPRHRYHFTPQALSRALLEAGFEICRTTLFSKALNAQALRQSLKLKLRGDPPSAFGRVLFFLILPFIQPLDWMMSARGKGATITVAARAL